MNWSNAETEIYEQALASVESCNKRIAKVYLLVQKEISDELKQFYLSIDPTWSATYQAARLSEIFKSINQKLEILTTVTTKQIQESYLEQYNTTFNNYSYDLSDYYSKPGAFPILPFTIPDESVIMAGLNAKIGEYSFLDSMSDKQGALREKLQDAVSISIAKGEGIPELTARLEEMFDSGISRYVTTARTEMLKAYSLAQEESTRQARDEMGIEFSYQWLSAADGRTRPAHATANGKFAKNFKEDGTPIFYIGASHGSGPRLLVGNDMAAQNINCRCRRLNIPMDIDEETMNNFPMTDKRPDYEKYMSMIS